MTTSEIKEIEGNLLDEYMRSLPRCDRKYFVQEVIKLCKYRITVKSFYNWRYKACRIPVFAKRAIERAAGKTIFIWEEPFVE